MVPVRPPLPIITSRQLAFPSKFKTSRQVWLSNLDTVEEEKLGLIDLHPEVFADKPRVDIIHENVRWQHLYRHVVSIVSPLNIKKTLLRSYNSNNFLNSRTRTRRSDTKSEAAEENHVPKRAPVDRATAPSARPSGRAAASSTARALQPRTFICLASMRDSTVSVPLYLLH